MKQTETNKLRQDLTSEQKEKASGGAARVQERPSRLDPGVTKFIPQPGAALRGRPELKPL